MKGKRSILNIGAGKKDSISEHFDYISDVDCFMVDIDKSYFDSQCPIYIESTHSKWLSNKDLKNRLICLNSNLDIFEFLERYKYKFSVITMYRFFEHISRDKLLYFIYLLSTVIEVGGMVDIIAPNYQELAKRIIREDPYDPEFDKDNIVIETEVFNEPRDPHQNITTPDRIRRLFEYENRFQYEKGFNPYLFDGRNIYFRSLMRRI